MRAERREGALRVLHCPTTIGGNPQGLARAEREIGLRSWAVAREQNRFNYPTDEVLFREAEGLVGREVKLWHLVWRALKDFDVVHYNFGSPILSPRHPVSGGRDPARRTPVQLLRARYDRAVRLRDLQLLRRAGKGIAVTFQGDDARQGDYSLANFPINLAREVEPGYYSPESDEQKRWLISQWARFAHRIYAVNPDLLHVLPEGAEFIPYASVDPREWQPIPGDGAAERPPVVLHAPSHRGVKGTRFILEAVERLRAEGVEFEFLLVENLSHAEAARLYRRADLLIDQLLAGWYGGLAVELMALGKPVMCYVREEDLRFLPTGMREDLPIIRATPESVYPVLRDWLVNRRHQLSDWGARGRAYVERWHDPLKIARRLASDYEQIASPRA